MPNRNHSTVDSGYANVAAGEAPFYIPAIDAPARPRRNLKHNNTFAVFDSHGDIGASAGGEDGLFNCDTRYLSHLELLVEGARPLLLHSAVNDANVSYDVDLTNPDIYHDGSIALLKDIVHIARSIFLSEGALRERIAIMNHGPHPIDLTLSIRFANDFADIFEVRGISRPKRGQQWREVIERTSVRLCYRGLDDRLRTTTLLFSPLPTRLDENTATFKLRLDPQERRTLLAKATAKAEGVEPPTAFFRGLIGLRRERKATTRAIATVETANSVVNDILCRSQSDLYMLTTRNEDGLYPYAGIPWYSTVFGRDGIITAMEMLWIDPAMAAGVLRHLARLQANSFDTAADAAPGKILHEMRGGEMAALHEVPFGQYYGSVDATPLFVMLVGQYADRTGDYGFVRELWPAVESALAWLDGPADLDGDGLVEYARGAATGLANQGWKDSHDSVFHADGSLATGPIALCEVQGYVYAARLAASRCAMALGLELRAAALIRQAEEIRKRFEESFWIDSLDFYATALDGDKRPCAVLTSNPGHALWAGIAERERGRHIAARLFDKDFFSGWGVRTVAEGASRYNPMSYHNGSIWPHDNAVIGYGIAKYGLKKNLIDIFEGLMRATSYLDQRRIPELYCGFRRRPGRGPTLYPAACSPQAWSAAAPFALIQAMIGLEFRPRDGEIRLNNPVVSAMAGAITLRNVSLGGASADFTVRSLADGGVTLEVLRTRGNLRISVVAH